MHARRFALMAFVQSLFLSLVVLLFATHAAIAQQSTPPTQVQTTSAANLRSGPGTSFAKVGSVPAGKTLAVKKCDSACNWYQLDSGAWIAAFLVKPVAEAAASSTASTGSPASSAPVTATVTGTVTGTVTATVTATSTAAAAPSAAAAQGPSAKSDGNLRSGPGTGYARVGGVTKGQSLDIKGKTSGGDWYQLADGNWIAAILIANPPADAPVVEAPAAPAPPSAPASDAGAATSGDPMQEAMKIWQDRIDLNTTKTCGHFEYKLTDVKRKKSVWLFNNEYVAQGEWLMVFVEVKNISPGTSYFGKFGPRLVTLAPDGTISQMTGDFKASTYAGWMFQHGDLYEDINPGKVLGLVEAYDVPLEPDMILGFGMLDCSDDLLSLGVWSKVPQATK